MGFNLKVRVNGKVVDEFEVDVDENDVTRLAFGTAAGEAGGMSLAFEATEAFIDLSVRGKGEWPNLDRVSDEQIAARSDVIESRFSKKDHPGDILKFNPETGAVLPREERVSAKKE
jgi:hypothetical protein